MKGRIYLYISFIYITAFNQTFKLSSINGLNIIIMNVIFQRYLVPE